MSKRKLLLADDSITIQKVVNLTFEDEGIDVITFGDGDSALENIEQIMPDIVLADVNMPGTDGYQLCELLRGNESTRDIPIVLLVGSFEPFDQDEANRVGADGHLTKPFSSIAELIATVHELLDKPAAEAGVADAAQAVPEISDIDQLYKQSFIETVEFSPVNDLGMTFNDDEIDDEMIQTSYADTDIDSLATASMFESGETDDFLDDLGTIHFAEPENGPDEPFRSASEAKDEAESSPHYPEPQIDDAPEAYDDGITESASEGNWPDQPTSGADEHQDMPAEHQSFAAAETIRFEAVDTAMETPKANLLNDLDLLELPTLPNGTSYHFATTEQTQGAPNKTQVVSLSPELMEIIVQKVVEKLAEKY